MPNFYNLAVLVEVYDAIDSAASPFFNDFQATVDRVSGGGSEL